MDIFDFIMLFGGLAFFLYGMHVLSSGLQRMAGGKLEGLLKKMSSNPLKSILLGTGITILLQSSSTTTVMLVGLVNSGIMQVGQTIGIIMGANIGSTATAWITSLSSIGEDASFVLKLIKPSTLSPIIALVGIILVMLAKDSKKKKDIGTILLGFAILMTGMDFMSASVEPLKEMEGVENVLVMFDNPLFGILIGAVVTGVIQSSAASVAMLQSISINVGITYKMAVPIILGQNIGTCVTALLSSIGTSRNARRVGIIHISFNLIGSILFLALFYGINAIVGFGFIEDNVSPQGIAIVHTVFNVFITAILLPFSKQIEKLSYALVREKQDEQEQIAFIDERVLKTPTVALTECSNLAVEMCRISQETINLSINNLRHFDAKNAEKIIQNEEIIDKYEDRLGTYLVKISSHSLSRADTNKVSKLLHTIGDFERLSDHAVNILKVAQEMNDKSIIFSQEANDEIRVISKALGEILDLTCNSFVDNNVKMAMNVEPLEQVIDGLIAKVKSNHVSRLQNGACTIELGFVWSDLLTNYERVSDHCSNIAVAVIETSRNSFETHEYLSSVKTGQNKQFIDAYNRYAKTFTIENSSSNQMQIDAE